MGIHRAWRRAVHIGEMVCTAVAAKIDRGLANRSIPVASIREFFVEEELLTKAISQTQHRLSSQCGGNGGISFCFQHFLFVSGSPRIFCNAQNSGGKENGGTG
ncbi:hypothetical protein SAMN05444385_103229 [Tritonibacter mobilis]|nr:hypothetical protein SAMN05444385_103229 [Tritonibacter mobilis]